MSWLKLDDGLMHHPKVIAAGEEAVMLFIGGLCHVGAHATDGQVDERALGALTPWAWGRGKLKRLALRLVDVGIWGVTPTGYEVADWLGCAIVAEPGDGEHPLFQVEARPSPSVPS